MQQEEGKNYQYELFHKILLFIIKYEKRRSTKRYGGISMTYVIGKGPYYELAWYTACTYQATMVSQGGRRKNNTRRRQQ